ncbi:serine/threonine-protein kinase [Streptomyces sp. NPDC051207]|uniref:serine/threonine-protein kinase n=1 Tax=Streptomyces sp. NPDC051207 TaxID=3154641 RepID=UPI003414DBBC
MGEVFAGRYELADPIGRGGVGAVWRAWDHRRRRYVAAKVLQQSDAHSLLRFVREQALRIDHPHVLAPASWAADDDKVLFTMDLVTGGSLVHLIGDYGPLPPAFVCTLLDQLLSGLAAVHAEGVVHRDIKPANVLLEATGTSRPRLRLSDFGIAIRLGEPRLTETHLVVGTPGYLAPEQMMGSEPDFPADLFAVGLVALYLLEGAKPDAKALVQYFAEHGTPGAPQGIPEPLWQVVATLLQPDPEARFRTATGARKALAAAAELLPEPGPDDELIEIFDQVGPLPPGFGPDGPLRRAPGVVVPGGGPGASREPSSPVAAAAAGDPRQGPGGTGSTGGTESAAVQEASAGTASNPGARAVAAGPSAAPSAADAPAVDTPEPRTSAPRPRVADTPEPENPPSAPQPPSMSDTGSFPLPPPRATATTAAAPGPPAAPHPPHVSPREATHALGHLQQPPAHPYAAPSPQPDYAAAGLSPHGAQTHRPPERTDASTASYTTQEHQGPPPVPRHRAARPRRPGPPARVVIPVLLLALACYAVGFWALARI